ncbi:hypothetical protein PR202_ga26884 [Eleusine coracana subsp. coracana]|uniref:Uncharacterized protein n=1 Tax=Eleusine coracana subsp. coracana TaxID=191504 RepID=A0AAV5DD74_ELECO|nr:hypothetical protein PR202_ga26884 [Eleusine coracana subsp. coracana]
MDGRRRGFLWSSEDKVSGADCLIAWDQVTKPKTHGGLGVRDLAIQNRCLLLKLMHRLHCSTDSSWAAWVTGLVDIPSMTGDLSGQHWDALRSLLPAYQELTQVSLGDGRTTSFWRDDWSPHGRLADLLLALFNHTKKSSTKKPSASVFTTLSTKLSLMGAPLHVHMHTLCGTTTPHPRSNSSCGCLSRGASNPVHCFMSSMSSRTRRVKCVTQLKRMRTT